MSFTVDHVRSLRGRHAFVVLSTGVLAACSSSSTNPSGTSTPVAPIADGGSAVEAGGPDAASITPRPDLCMGLARGGAVVEEHLLSGQPPVAAGGTIVQGTYDLVEFDAYDGDSPDAGADDAGETPSTRLTGRAAQVTVVVGEFSMSTVEARGTSAPDGLAPEQTHGVLYRIDGTSLIETAVCPSTALPAPTSFSVVSESIILFPDATHRELYKLRP